METKKLFVRNLPYSVTDDQLRDFFAASGRTVESAVVIMDRATGRSKGFGFVEMTSIEDAEAVMAETDGKEMAGRPISVSEARPREERPRFDRPRY